MSGGKSIIQLVSQVIPEVHYLKIFFVRSFIHAVKEQEIISLDQSSVKRGTTQRNEMQKNTFHIFFIQLMPASHDHFDYIDINVFTTSWQQSAAAQSLYLVIHLLLYHIAN